MDFELPRTGLPTPRLRRPRSRLLVVAMVLLTAAVIVLFIYHAMNRPDAPRVIVLGFDGLDPQLIEQYAAAGLLPNFTQFIAEGNFHRLATSNPAQSPVSWSSFISGCNPGQHGIFDFLRRDPQSYMPDLALFAEEANTITGGASVKTLRQGTQFWDVLTARGIPVTTLHLPMTFPPAGATTMLAGMGVPDIRGTQGTFIYLTDQPAGRAMGGEIVSVSFRGNSAATGIPGPNSGNSQSITIPLTVARDNGALRLEVADTVIVLRPGQWSGWVKMAFAVSSLTTVHAQGRFYLASADPLELYLSPLQFDPQHPLFPISVPGDYAAEIENELGPYHTLGMPEETWAVNEGRLSDTACREQYDAIFTENEQLLDRELARQKSGLLVWVTMVTDRAQHMFWRASDPRHPLYTRELAEAQGDAIRHFYQRADAVIGRVRAQLKPDDVLIVMSDHGFNSFRRTAHVNAFLRQRGFLKLKDSCDTSAEFFAQVDWSRTSAYAVGLNSVYINRRGREGQGIVDGDSEVSAIKRTLTTALAAWRDCDTRVVNTVYDAAQIYRGEHAAEWPDLLLGFNYGYRASWQTALGAVPAELVEDNTKKWSGDHCIDPLLVPGFIASTRPFRRRDPAISDIAPTLLDYYLGNSAAADIKLMDGQSLW